MTQTNQPNLISCRVCGKIMVKLSRDVCQTCYVQEEELFAKVKDFLKANPGATVEEVANTLQTTKSKIEFFIKSGRLERIGLQISHPCETCGKIIKTGIICSDCSKELKEKVNVLKEELMKKLEKKVSF